LNDKLSAYLLYIFLLPEHQNVLRTERYIFHVFISETNYQKKMSIPVTVSRVLKYIPELQKHVAKITKKKEQLLAKGSKWQEHNSTLKNRCIDSLVVTATCLTDKEVMVNICILSNKANKTPLFKYLEILDGEGLKLINASTVSASLAERTFYSLHFEVYSSYLPFQFSLFFFP
jgi:hypothetical protein